MNFTRDPIIETVITPREGCKLVVRSSKGANQEDYYVDALEVVSFGHSFFFRSLEKPKSFLVPVSDYEIFETKEPKLALKNASSERSIKIGGGRESAPRPVINRETIEEVSQQAPEQSQDRKPRDGKPQQQRRRGNRRGGRDRNDTYAPQGDFQASPREEEAAPESVEMAPQEKAPSFVSKLFPPPTTLIRETIGRYKSPDPAGEDLFMVNSGESVSLEERGSLENGNQEPHASSASDEDDEE